MKTKITAVLLFATVLSTTSFAQNSWKPAPANSYAVPETPVQVMSRTETFFGADFEYTSQGAKIKGIIPNSPAESYNFRNGDIIHSIGSATINSEESYIDALQNNKPDETVTVSYTRKGVQKTRKVKLDKITVFRNSK